ncbi:MAG TPA: DUF4169 family protein [Phenylobacterium sp.]
MSGVVNLNKARKAKAKADAKRTAEANRAKHGRSKGEKAEAKSEVARLDRRLDDAKRED